MTVATLTGGALILVVAPGADPEAEIARLVDLGAKRIADKDEWGHAWTVLQDPEGNELCVSRVE